VSYLLMIFIFPWTSKKIENTIWLDWLNESVVEVKSKIDKVSTDSLELYNTTIETTDNLVDHFFHWLKIIKNNIDKLRLSLSEKKETAKKLKDSYNDIKERIDTASWIINDTKDTIDTINKVKESLTNSWNLSNTWNTN
jgi:chromosome segregation ATPase